MATTSEVPIYYIYVSFDHTVIRLERGCNRIVILLCEILMDL